jgi:hypothetical protein
MSQNRPKFAIPKKKSIHHNNCYTTHPKISLINGLCAGDDMFKINESTCLGGGMGNMTTTFNHFLKMKINDK